MATNLILNVDNYSDANLTNGKTYFNGSTYACNYPLDVNTSFSLNVTLGSKYATAAVGDFQDLLGCDIQNNNVPVRKWLYGVGGEVLEIDYIVSSTQAVLKEPSSYNITGVTFVVVDYWGSPNVSETIITNTDDFGVIGGLVNTSIGPLILDLASSESISIGTKPITIDLGTTATQCTLTVIYST